MLKELFLEVLKNYARVKTEPMKNHPFRKVVRIDIVSAFLAVVDQRRYTVKGSVGLGQNWNSCPWIAVFDKLVTDTVQNGFYPVFLFRADLSGVYLSLNQGVTDVRRTYKAKTADVLRARASNYLAMIGKPPPRSIVGEIDLRAPKNVEPHLYNYGNVFGFFYPANRVPPDEQIFHDFRSMMDAYAYVVEKDPESITPTMDDGLQTAEGLNTFEESLKIRFHQRIERNRRLSGSAKEIHGYKCQACGFDYSVMYGEIGRGYIEAHHLVPISKLSRSTTLNPQTDFAVLCANCHRMIHRMEDVGDIEQLRKVIKAA